MMNRRHSLLAWVPIVSLFLGGLPSAGAREADTLSPLEESVVAALPVVPPKLNEAYSLEISPAKKVTCVYTLNVQAPHLEAVEWVVFAPKPPDLPYQTVINATTVPKSQVIRELSSMRQPIFRVRQTVTDLKGLKNLAFTETIEANLSARHLVNRRGKTPATVEELSNSDRKLALLANSQFNYTDPKVKNWIVRHGLVRAATEGEVDFARRVFQTIAREFRYEYTGGTQERSAPHVCTAGASDCGGLSAVFVSVLRSQGIPARSRVGRWAQSAKPGEKVGTVEFFQQHVKAEFYAQGVGWVPVDASAAVSHDRTPEKLKFFGHDTGDFITLGLDTDLSVDTIYFGVHSILYLQSPQYWVTGSGNLNDTVKKENWQVKEEPVPAAK